LREFKPRQYVYRITLTCGHSFKASDQPFRHNTTYACKYTPSCGYSLPWTACVTLDSGFERLNPGVEA
jgi:hypothetical protein